MAPQLEMDEQGSTFYGSVPMGAPKVEERKTASTTLKMLVGMAVVAVALTAAVFAFTSPVSNNTAEVVDAVLPACELTSSCFEKAGYDYEGVGIPKVTPCRDVQGNTAGACSAGDKTLTKQGAVANAKCAACNVVSGENACFKKPCKNGGQCFDRAYDSTAPQFSPKWRGFFCHCPYGFSGAQCQDEVDVCKLTAGGKSVKFCDNGMKNTVCKTDADCKYIFQKTTDVASKCTIVAGPPCDPNAKCIKGKKGRYTCQCRTGFKGDGYAADQKTVAFGSILKTKCAKIVKTMRTKDSKKPINAPSGAAANALYTEADFSAANVVAAHGWLDRSCTADGITQTPDIYVSAGCVDENDCKAGLCQNGGSCFDNFNANFRGTGADAQKSYTCKCAQAAAGPEGCTGADCRMIDIFKNDHCSKDVNECTALTLPCGDAKKGSCVNTAGSFKCTCNKGWTPAGSAKVINGFFAGCKDADDCASKPCKNGATCTDLKLGTGKFKCTCAKGWKGDICDKDINECKDATAYDCPTNSHCENVTPKSNKQGWYCACDKGWEWKVKPSKKFHHLKAGYCVDADDCVSKPCGDNGACQDHGLLQFLCVCKSGWKGKTCQEDIDECAEFTLKGHVCHKDASCINTGGSWKCECDQGFSGDGKVMCAPVNDCWRWDPAHLHKFCASDMSTCATDADCSGACVYTAGGKVTRTLTKCANTAACVADAGLKKLGWTGGAFTCDASYKKCSNDAKKTADQYPKGELSAATQFLAPAPWAVAVRSKDAANKPVDQCGVYTAKTAAKAATWAPHGTCTDEGVNAFVCKCDNGWTDSNCDRDVNECAKGTHECSKYAECVNTAGSYTCACKAGFQDDEPQCRKAGDHTVACGLGCHDIDDCTTSTKDKTKCVHAESCTDLGQTAYKCTCTEGWMDVDCDVDINECGMATHACHANAECGNTPGSYECTCADGFTGTGLASAGAKGCVEIDDCATNPCEHGKCVDDGFKSHHCVSPKSFKAKKFSEVGCEAGWQDKNCDFDVNECVAVGAVKATHTCHASGKCVNTPGSYYCRCLSGFAGDGYTCTDLDDCDPNPCGQVDKKDQCGGKGPNYSAAKRYACFGNTPSGIHKGKKMNGCFDLGANKYKCNCCPGWTGDACCTDVDECDKKTPSNKCASGARCENTPGSYDCACKAGTWDPCKCKGKLPNRVCKDVKSGKTCEPGRVCNTCTQCNQNIVLGEGQHWSCARDPTWKSAKKYWPWNPQFLKSPPAMVQTLGPGFQKKPDSPACKHQDNICVNVDECSDKAPCNGNSVCTDTCGSFQCACKGNNEETKKCFFGSSTDALKSGTCKPCTVCKGGEYMLREATSTHDRICRPFVPNGDYAIENEGGAVAQCLVKWSQSEKAFPERYNWGGKSPTQTGSATGKIKNNVRSLGTDSADLCANPICGVCNWNGVSAKKNIISGKEARWAFRRVGNSNNYMILSNADGKGYRCLGFQNDNEPYPEAMTYECSTGASSSGVCKFGHCSIDKKGCSIDGQCPDVSGKKQTCKRNVCTKATDCTKYVCDKKPKEEECYREGIALDNKVANSKVVGDYCSEAGTCKKGGFLTSTGAFCTADNGADKCNVGGTCEKHSAANCKWTTQGKGPINLNKPYFCGFKSLGASPAGARLVGDGQAVWTLFPLGCSGKQCHKRKYPSLYLIGQTRNVGGKKKLECLYFPDVDAKMYSHPRRVPRTAAPGGLWMGSHVSSNLCGINAGDQTPEDALIAQKGAVFKLISLA